MSSPSSPRLIPCCPHTSTHLPIYFDFRHWTYLLLRRCSCGYPGTTSGQPSLSSRQSPRPAPPTHWRGRVSSRYAEDSLVLVILTHGTLTLCVRMWLSRAPHSCLRAMRSTWCRVRIQVKVLIERMWSRDPKLRPTAKVWSMWICCCTYSSAKFPVLFRKDHSLTHLALTNALAQAVFACVKALTQQIDLPNMDLLETSGDIPSPTAALTPSHLSSPSPVTNSESDEQTSSVPDCEMGTTSSGTYSNQTAGAKMPATGSQDVQLKNCVSNSDNHD